MRLPRFKARAQDAAVAPVVITSSISSTLLASERSSLPCSKRA